MPITGGSRSVEAITDHLGRPVLRVYAGTGPTPIWTPTRAVPGKASAPTLVLAAGVVTVTLTAVATATGYRISREEAPGLAGQGVVLDLMAELTTPFTLAAGRSADVFVQAYNAGGYGPWSDGARASAPAVTPDPGSSRPVLRLASRRSITGGASITIAWSRPSGATWFRYEDRFFDTVMNRWSEWGASVTTGLSADLIVLTGVRDQFRVSAHSSKSDADFGRSPIGGGYSNVITVTG